MANFNFASLKSVLQSTGLQQRDNGLFQVINQLIGLLSQLQSTNNADIASAAASGASPSLDYLTWTDESIGLVNSRQLMAGTGVTFDDTVAHKRTINVPSTAYYYAPLTDGDLVETDLIFASGDCIMVQIPL